MLEFTKRKKIKSSTHLLILIGVLILLSAPPSWAEDALSVEEKLEAIEEQLLDLQMKQSEKTKVTAFDAIKLDIGGFITQTLTSNFNGDSPDRTSFDQTNMELLVGADVTDRDHFFAAVGFLRQSDLINESGATDVTKRDFAGSVNRVPGIIMWGRHDFSDLFDITYGRFIDPWGIINVEHFPPVLFNLNQPQYLRATQPGNLFGGNTIVPNFLNGVQLHGSLYPSNHHLNYFVYTGNFNGQGSSDFISGTRLTWSPPSEQVTLGGSFQHGITDNSSNDHYNAFGIDFKVDYKGFLLKSEYVYSDIRGRGDKEAYYLQPAYTLGKWTLFYRFDFLDQNQSLKDDTTEQTEHVVGINFLPSPLIRLRAEYVFNRFDAKLDTSGRQRDYDNIQVSITTSF